MNNIHEVFNKRFEQILKQQDLPFQIMGRSQVADYAMAQFTAWFVGDDTKETDRSLTLKHTYRLSNVIAYTGQHGQCIGVHFYGLLAFQISLSTENDQELLVLIDPTIYEGIVENFSEERAAEVATIMAMSVSLSVLLCLPMDQLMDVINWSTRIGEGDDVEYYLDELEHLLATIQLLTSQMFSNPVTALCLQYQED